MCEKHVFCGIENRQRSYSDNGFCIFISNTNLSLSDLYDLKLILAATESPQGHMDLVSTHIGGTSTGE